MQSQRRSRSRCRPPPRRCGGRRVAAGRRRPRDAAAPGRAGARTASARSSQWTHASPVAWASRADLGAGFRSRARARQASSRAPQSAVGRRATHRGGTSSSIGHGVRRQRRPHRRSSSEPAARRRWRRPGARVDAPLASRRPPARRAVGVVQRRVERRRRPPRRRGRSPTCAVPGRRLDRGRRDRCHRRARMMRPWRSPSDTHDLAGVLPARNPGRRRGSTSRPSARRGPAPRRAVTGPASASRARSHRAPKPR